MKTTQVARLALRLSYSQHPSPDRVVFRSAAFLALTGLGLCSFSLKQMLQHQRKIL